MLSKPDYIGGVLLPLTQTTLDLTVSGFRLSSQYITRLIHGVSANLYHTKLTTKAFSTITSKEKLPLNMYIMLKDVCSVVDRARKTY